MGSDEAGKVSRINGGERQLIINLPHRPALEREDFIVGACNEQAVAVIDRWPDWPQPVFVIVGPAGSGKSHLALVWQARTGAKKIRASELRTERVPDLLSECGLVMEDGETLRDESALFHLLNLGAQEGVYLLLTSIIPPAHWKIQDDALSSRLSSIPSVLLEAPSDDVLGGVLEKLFRDRQLEVSEDLVPYLVARMERSFAAAQHMVDALDRVSLAQHRKIGKRLASEILDQNMV